MEETKRFLINEGVRSYGGFFATAYPGSALFEYAMSKGLIQDVDNYMSKIDNASRFSVNYTTLSDESLQLKVAEVASAVQYAWHKKRGLPKSYLSVKSKQSGICQLQKKWNKNDVIPATQFFFFIAWLFFGRRLTGVVKEVFKRLTVKPPDWDMPALDYDQIGKSNVFYFFRKQIAFMVALRQSYYESGVVTTTGRVLEHFGISLSKRNYQ